MESVSKQKRKKEIGYKRSTICTPWNTNNLFVSFSTKYKVIIIKEKRHIHFEKTKVYTLFGP